MDDKLAAELKEAEAAVAHAEKELGPTHPDLADKLQRYANLLRKTERRALDAVNVEARARVIRAKILAEDEAAHGTKISTEAAKPARQPKKSTSAAAGMYLGFLALIMAASALGLPQSYLPALLIGAVLLSLTDIVLSQAAFWRAAVVACLSLVAWWCNAAVPSSMLVDESPINRFNYASEFPDLVENIKRLGKPVPILNYRICLPQGFSQAADEVKDWGRVLTYTPAVPAQEGEQAQPAAPATAQMRFLLIRLPAGGKTRGPAGRSLLKVAKEIVMPHLSEIENWRDVREQPAHFEEIDGMNFAKITFFATGDKWPNSGFVYLTTLNRTVFVIYGGDVSAQAESTVPLMDAAVYTIKGVSSAEPDLE